MSPLEWLPRLLAVMMGASAVDYSASVASSLRLLADALEATGDDVLEVIAPSLEALEAIAGGIATAIEYVEAPQ